MADDLYLDEVKKKILDFIETKVVMPHDFCKRCFIANKKELVKLSRDSLADIVMIYDTALNPYVQQ